MATQPEIMQCIETAADIHGLPVALVAAIVKTESSFDPAAIRYEPQFYARYIVGKPIAAIPPCSPDTERTSRAISWGLMQIMGATARERGFRGAFLSELCDPAVGLYWGCAHLVYLKSQYQKSHGTEGVIAAYNAGSPRKNHIGQFVNQLYVERIREAGGFQ